MLVRYKLACTPPLVHYLSRAGVLSLEHAAVSVSMRVQAPGPSDGSGSSSSPGAFFVAAVSEAAELYVWVCTPAAAAAERRVSTRLLTRITVGASRRAYITAQLLCWMDMPTAA